VQHARGRACIADSGYSGQPIHDAIRARGMKPVVAQHPLHPRRGRLDRKLYGLRYKIECGFHTLKRFRAVATRYDKSATSFLSTVHVACILAWLN
jgi:transposase